MSNPPITRRRHNIPMEVYRPDKTVDTDWGIDDVSYQYVTDVRVRYLASAAMQAGTRRLEHHRDEIHEAFEAIVNSIPVVEENDLMVIRSPDGEVETVFMVRAGIPLGRGDTRLMLDRKPSFQLDDQELKDES